MSSRPKPGIRWERSHRAELSGSHRAWTVTSVRDVSVTMVPPLPAASWNRADQGENHFQWRRQRRNSVSSFVTWHTCYDSSDGIFNAEFRGWLRDLLPAISAVAFPRVGV